MKAILPFFLSLCLAPALSAQAGSYRLFGKGCNGVSFVNRGVPTIGASFSLILAHSVRPPRHPLAVLHFGASNTRWGSIRLPLDLTPYGLKGCSIYCTNELTVRPMPTTPRTMIFTVRLPRLRSLLGVRFFNQFIVLNPHTKPIRWATSNGGAGSIGR